MIDDNGDQVRHGRGRWRTTGTSRRSRPMFSTWCVHVHLWVPMASNWSLIPGIAQSKNRQRTVRRLVGHGHREDCNWSTSSSHPWLPFASTTSTVDITRLAISSSVYVLLRVQRSRTQAAINTYVTPKRGRNSRGQPLFFYHRSPLPMSDPYLSRPAAKGLRESWRQPPPSAKGCEKPVPWHPQHPATIIFQASSQSPYRDGAVSEYHDA